MVCFVCVSVVLRVLVEVMKARVCWEGAGVHHERGSVAR